jgi:hypothetical protein
VGVSRACSCASAPPLPPALRQLRATRAKRRSGLVVRGQCRWVAAVAHATGHAFATCGARFTGTAVQLLLSLYMSDMTARRCAAAVAAVHV